MRIRAAATIAVILLAGAAGAQMAGPAAFVAATAAQTWPATAAQTWPATAAQTWPATAAETWPAADETWPAADETSAAMADETSPAAATSTPSPKPAPPAAIGSGASESTVPAPPRPWLAPTGSLVVNLPSDQAIPRGILQFLVTHRFRAPVRGSNAHELYSLDSGSDFGFGFAYSPVERGELSLYRSGLQDDWELAAKYAFVPAGHAFGAALRVGGNDRRDPFFVTESGGILPAGDAKTSFFAQGILSLHAWHNRVEVSAIPEYSSETTAEKHAFNVAVHAAVALTRSWNVQGEYQPQRRSVPDSIGMWSIGLEKTLYRHRFTLVISNTTVTTVDQYLSGDFSAAAKRRGRQFDNGFRNDDWHIGFNLVRQWKP